MTQETIGWIGTGVMGAAMCGHLLKAGHKVNIFNRSKQKAAPLLSAGANWCKGPAAVAGASRIVFVMVGFPQDVEQVILGPGGVLEAATPETVVIDMTTSSPNLAVRIHRQASGAGAASLDAPVSGGDIGARQASLSIMAGGEKAVFEKVLPLFRLMGKNIRLMGGPGSGQHTKMSNQILIAGTMIGVVESLLYGYKAGLDLNALIDVIGQGAASCWSINNLGRRIVDGDFEPGFYIKHFVKDMGIALNEARRMSLCLPGLALVHQFYAAATACGLEHKGTQALYKVLENLNGLPGAAGRKPGRPMQGANIKEQPDG